MKRSEILNGLALLASMAAIVIVLSSAHSNNKRIVERAEKLNQLVDAKVAQSTDSLREELVQRLDTIITSLDLTETGRTLAENVDL